jgi:hypothetical protein
MMSPRALRLPLLLAAVALLCAAPAVGQMQMQEAAKKVLDHDAYDTWNRIGASAVSADGRWVLYGIVSEANDPVLTVTSVDGATTHVVERAESARFGIEHRYVVFTIKPSKAAVKEARERRVRTEQLPADTLGILDLQTGDVVRVARLRSFRMPDEAGGLVAYQLGREPNAARADSVAAPAEPAPGATPPQRIGAGPHAGAADGRTGAGHGTCGRGAAGARRARRCCCAIWQPARSIVSRTCCGTVSRRMPRGWSSRGRPARVTWTVRTSWIRGRVR